MKTITHHRPFGAISVIVKELEGKTILTRSPSMFVPVSTSFEVDTPPQQAIAMLNAWANGAVAQDALKDWSVQIREWLITGFEPGSEMNPYPH